MCINLTRWCHQLNQDLFRIFVKYKIVNSNFSHNSSTAGHQISNIHKYSPCKNVVSVFWDADMLKKTKKWS